MVIRSRDRGFGRLPAKPADSTVSDNERAVSNWHAVSSLEWRAVSSAPQDVFSLRAFFDLREEGEVQAPVSGHSVIIDPTV